MTYLQAAIETYRKLHNRTPSDWQVAKWEAKLGGFAHVTIDRF